MLDENQVIEFVCRHLEESGHDIIQRLNTTQPGIDVVARNSDSGEVLLIEAKGSP